MVLRQVGWGVLHRLLVVLLVVDGMLAGSEVAWADIYRKVEDGQVIFADHPFDGAEQIEERPINTVPAFGAPPAGDSETAKKPQDVVLRVQINAPEEGQTFAFGTDVPVDYQVLPQLPAKDRVIVLVDGVEVHGTTLKHLERGEHVLEVQVKDAHDKVLLKKTVSFMVFQHSLLGPHP